MPIAIAAAVACLTAVVLVVVGLRGPRAGGPPRCRRCGRELAPRPADGVCPRCGADVRGHSGLVLGKRTARRRPLAAGAVLLPVGLAAFAVWGPGAAAALWRKMEPVGFLARQVDGDADGRAAPLAELVARLLDGRLSDDGVRAVAGHVLAVQRTAGLTAPAVAPGDAPSWATFIEVAHARGRLDPDLWAAYAQQAVAVALTVPSAVRLGTAPPVQITGTVRGTPAFAARYDVADLLVDGRPVPSPWSPSDRFAGHDGELGRNGVGPPPAPVDADAGPLPVGKHSVTATVHVLVFDADPSHRSPAATAPAAPLVTLDVPVSAPFVVYDPKGVLLPTVAPTPELTRDMAHVIQIQRVQLTGGGHTLDVTGWTSASGRRWGPAALPVPLRVRLCVRPAGSTAPPTESAQPIDPSTGWGQFDATVPAPPGLKPGTSVDVILRPAPLVEPTFTSDGQLVTVDPKRAIWSQDIVIPNVVVEP